MPYRIPTKDLPDCEIFTIASSTCMVCDKVRQHVLQADWSGNEYAPAEICASCFLTALATILAKEAPLHSEIDSLRQQLTKALSEREDLIKRNSELMEAHDKALNTQ